MPLFENGPDYYEDELTVVDLQLVAKFTYKAPGKLKSKKEVDLIYFEVIENEYKELDVTFTGYCKKSERESSFRVSKIVGHISIEGDLGQKSVTQKKFITILKSISNKHTPIQNDGTNRLTIAVVVIGIITAVSIWLAILCL